jgi:O-acetyl-ADP-ribose deacetylase (regulator of RNase III)
MPVIGTGTAGFEFKKGAHIVCKAIAAHESSSLDDVQVITNIEQEHDYLKRIAANI